MSFKDDLAMGLGLKERDQDYYDRTAANISRQRGKDAGQRYLQQVAAKGTPAQGGLLSFMAGGKDKGSNIIPQMFGYRDFTDMTDRGGPQASGGQFQGGGGYSLLANLGAMLSGQDMGERKTYDDQAIDQQYGEGFAANLKQNSPMDYMRFLKMVQGGM